MNLSFTGYYGQLNTGDDAFCVIADWGAKYYWNQQNVRFLGRNLPSRLDGSNLTRAIASQSFFKGQHVLESFIAGLTSRNIVYAGGSLFHLPVTGYRRDAIFKIAHSINKVKLGAIGVSIGPFKTKDAYKTNREYLSSFSFLALRDRRSYEEAMNMQLSIPVIEAFDLAALLPEIYPQVKKDNKFPILGVTICNYERFVNGDRKKEEKRVAKIISCIKLVAKRIPNLKVKILIFNSHPEYGDIALSNKLMQAIMENAIVEKVNYNSNPYVMWEEISKCSVVLSTRLHSGIFACFSGTPFVQIEYHNKCTDFLQDVGYDKNFRIGDFEINEHEVSDKIITLMQPQNSVMAKNLNACKEKASLNFTSFEDFFKKP